MLGKRGSSGGGEGLCVHLTRLVWLSFWGRGDFKLDILFCRSVPGANAEWEESLVAEAAGRGGGVVKLVQGRALTLRGSKGALASHLRLALGFLVLTLCAAAVDGDL